MVLVLFYWGWEILQRILSHDLLQRGDLWTLCALFVRSHKVYLVHTPKHHSKQLQKVPNKFDKRIGDASWKRYHQRVDHKIKNKNRTGTQNRHQRDWRLMVAIFLGKFRVLPKRNPQNWIKGGSWLAWFLVLRHNTEWAIFIHQILVSYGGKGFRSQGCQLRNLRS